MSRASTRRTRVLLVPCETARWQQAQSLPCAMGWDVEARLTGAGVDCTMLPALQEFPSQSPRSWLYHASSLLAGETFDQAWVWLTYNFYDIAFFEWLSAVAPVRVGVVAAPMEYSYAEYAASPHLLWRRDFVDRHLASMTHAVTIDDADAPRFTARLGIAARPLCSPVAAAPPLEDRLTTLDSASATAPPNSRPASGHAPTPRALQFDELQRRTIVGMTSGTPTRAMLDAYVSDLRTVRSALRDENGAARAATATPACVMTDGVADILAWIDRHERSAPNPESRATTIAGCDLSGPEGGVASNDSAPVHAERTIAYEVAADLTRELGYTRLVDLGCAHPPELMRIASRVDAVAIAAADTVRAHERRCSSIRWVATPEASTIAGSAATLVLSVGQFTGGAAEGALVLLARLLESGGCALLEERTPGWRDRLGNAGLDIIHDAPLPASRARRALTSAATIVVHRSCSAAERARIQAAAAIVIDRRLAERERLSNAELFAAALPAGPCFLAGTALPAPRESAPPLHVLLEDDGIVAMHGRSPADEGARWASQLEPLGRAPLVLYGLGLGHHATAAASRGDADRVIVVEPFDDVVRLARQVAATREALDRGRVEIVRDWAGFSELARRSRVDVAALRVETLPIYRRLAPADHASFTLLADAARAWHASGLGNTVKPFCHPPGMSVVVPTWNRIEAACVVARAIAAQECDVPFELLIVNDGGDPAVFEAVRRAIAGSGLDVRGFDTHYQGFGAALARNIGLRAARYDTVVFLDDDVRVERDLLAQYRRAPEGVRAGRVDFEYADGGTRRLWPDRRLALHGGTAVLRPWPAFEEFLWGANCAIRTELALALGGFDEAFLGEGGEDTDFGARAVRATQRPVVVPAARALHDGLDRGTRVWFGLESGGRPATSRALLADPARGVVVNGGVGYWSGTRWERFAVETAQAV